MVVAVLVAVAGRFPLIGDAAAFVVMMMGVDRDRAAYMGSVVRIPGCGRRRQPQGGEGEAEQAEEAAERRMHGR